MLLSRLVQPGCHLVSQKQQRSRSNSRPRALIVRASGAEGNGTAFEEGATVRVTAEVKVFHAPKAGPEGINLQGKEGVVAKNVAHYKDKHLSPNLPYKVQFNLEKEGAPAKFFAHLGDDEIELVS